MNLSPKTIFRYFIRIQDYFYLNLFFVFIGLVSLTDFYFNSELLPSGIGAVLGLIFDTFIGGASWLFLLWSLTYSANKKFKLGYSIPGFRKIIVFLFSVAFLLSTIGIGGLLAGGLYSVVLEMFGKIITIVIAFSFFAIVCIDLFNLDIQAYKKLLLKVKGNADKDVETNNSSTNIGKTTLEEQSSEGLNIAPDNDDNVDSQTTMPRAGMFLKKKYPLIDFAQVGLSKNVDFTNKEQIDINKRELESIFKDFNVKCEVQEAFKGLMVSIVILKLSSKQKISVFRASLDNVAVQLGHREGEIRISDNVDVKPGEVAIEIPLETRTFFNFKDVFEEVKKSQLSALVGITATGETFELNIPKLPHILVSGTTGSGKSFALNSIITSLLTKNSPNDLRLLLIDPKSVEFSIYENIPHLMIPVITSSEKAISSLQQLTEIMDDRFKILHENKCRSIQEYHQNLSSRAKKFMPYIVVVVDELSDLMMNAGKEVENHIVKLAQKSRACGIHLILCTQRPSVDVVTGLMKANIPARMALKTASKIDSKIIIDKDGAESLLGKGDALIKIPSEEHLIRLQVPYLDTLTTSNVCKLWGE